MLTQAFRLLTLTVFFCLGLLVSIDRLKLASLDFASTTSAGSAKYYLSGYIHSAPDIKSYLLINNGKIETISSRKPEKLDIPLIETDAWIFPGLINLHNHLKYNVLPLWPGAKGQFVNRYEWRDNSGYQDFAKFNMKAVPPEGVCAAVRWAELKELFSGVSATQGIGGDGACAFGFGPRNVEASGELKAATRAVALLDTIDPSLLKPIYHGILEPLMQKENLSYDQAVQKFLQDSGVPEWYQSFNTSDRTIAAAFKLTIGEVPQGIDLNLNTEVQFNDLKKTIRDFFLERGIGSEKTNSAGKADVDSKIDDLKYWIFGGGRIRSGFMSFKQNTDLEKTKKDIVELMSAGIVKIIPAEAKRYSLFEEGIRQKMRRDSVTNLGLVIHLSEGRRDDAYSQKEYDYMRATDINFSKNVMIHAVGLTSQQLDEVAKLKQSIVWSPFSNLLLYGQTLNVAEVLKRKINLAIATDWSISGSKTLFEELRLAKKYLMASKEAQLSDRDLFEAVTVTPAKILGVEDSFGSISKHYSADIVVIKKNSENPYADFVETTEFDLELMIIGGEPLYGKPEHVKSYSAQIKQAIENEVINVCGTERIFRPVLQSESDGKTNLRTYSEAKKSIQDYFAAYRASVESSGNQKQIKNLVAPDTMFSCEDKKYQQFIDDFISTKWPSDRRDLQKNRQGLKENFNPME